jgi:hypothetical protein
MLSFLKTFKHIIIILFTVSDRLIAIIQEID